MNRRRWKLWVAGIALVQLLVIGVDVALLWPMPSEAKRSSALVEVGMEWQRAKELIPTGEIGPMVFRPDGLGGVLGPPHVVWIYSDSSQLGVYLDLSASRVTSVVYIPPSQPVPPLIRLRRTLTRIIPALRE
jgi:hypothetical protein